MALADDFKADMATFLDSAAFAEAVTYLPSAGGTKPLNAVVKREGLRAQEHGGRQAPTKVIEVTIAKDAALGVESVKVRHDKVEVLYELDDLSVTTFFVAKILKQDQGAWTLECWA